MGFGFFICVFIINAQRRTTKGGVRVKGEGEEEEARTRRVPSELAIRPSWHHGEIGWPNAASTSSHSPPHRTRTRTHAAHRMPKAPASASKPACTSAQCRLQVLFYMTAIFLWDMILFSTISGVSKQYLF